MTTANARPMDCSAGSCLGPVAPAGTSQRAPRAARRRPGSGTNSTAASQSTTISSPAAGAGGRDYSAHLECTLRRRGATDVVDDTGPRR